MPSKLTPEQERAAIEAQIERLVELSMKQVPASLPEALAALTHPDREVREAAIEATMQLGDSNVIPALKQASEMAHELDEKVAFLEAIEFLSVTPLTFDNHSVSKSPEQIEAAKRRRALEQN